MLRKPSWQTAVLFSAAMISAALGCGQATKDEQPTPSSGGSSSPLGGASLNGGKVSAGGTASTSSGGRVTNDGGAIASDGGTSSASAGSESSAGATAAAGAESTGGAQTSGGATSTGGSAAAGEASARGGSGSGGVTTASRGCTLANPVVPDHISSDPPATDNQTVWAELEPPDGYDGVTPVPLIAFFHATNQISDARNLIKDQPRAKKYLIATFKITDSGMTTFEGSRPQKSTQILNQLLDTLCIDQSRIFLAGNGSGARFMMNWVAERNRAKLPPFRAAALVGTLTRVSLGAPLPMIFLHAKDSNNSAGVAQDRDGLKALGYLSTNNSCGETSRPLDVAGCNMQGLVTPGCVDFDDCAAPLRFCHHDTTYQSGDIWPCFGAQAVYDFFDPYLASSVVNFETQN